MMDQNMHQDLQNFSFLRKYKFLNMVFQFLLPLSVFSILISYYSWVSLFSHCFNPYSSSSPFYILYSTIDRKYLFLFCNAILVLLSTNSGLIGSSSLKTHSQVNYVVANEVLVQSVVEEGKRNGEEEEAKGIFMTKEEEVEEDYEEEEENDEDEGGHAVLSTEELKNKFDEFIRRMKEQIRFEAER